MIEKINEAVTFLIGQTGLRPGTAIILGTGLGALTAEIKIEKEIPYDKIPHFPLATVESHGGRLLFGFLNGKEVMVMQGRFHYYEGYSMQEVTFPVRVMKQMGAKRLFISNASGALNRNYGISELMLLSDHINLFPENPLRGKNYESLGPRFPDMSEPYSVSLRNKAKEIAQRMNIKLHEGVYAGIQGPTLETKAEYRYLGLMGADVVGMSTVPEVLVARHMGMKVLAVSVVTDLGFPESLKPLTLEEVIAAARKAEPQLTMLIKEMMVA